MKLRRCLTAILIILSCLGAGNTSSLAATLVSLNSAFALPEKYTVVARYTAPLPLGLTVDLAYTKYTIDPNYIVVTAWGANIRALPEINGVKVGKAVQHEKLKAIALVRGEYSSLYRTDLWYEVIWRHNGQEIHGYLLATLADYRSFQFIKMVSASQALKDEVDFSLTAYIDNYKNHSGIAPLHQGQTVDASGEKRYQAAPAYFSESLDADFCYLPDGALVTIVAESELFYRVKSLNFEGELFVPKRFVSLSHSIGRLRQVIVIDRKNQNEGVFEYQDGYWKMISFSYATTGELARYKEPTPLGYFMGIQKVSKFIYLDDVTRQIDGYAPYAIRFAGGAYIHGWPVDFAPGQVVGKSIVGWPPMRESSATLGTLPRSHKCVRNYTSHAKFLYDWYVPGELAVIVIE